MIKKKKKNLKELYCFPYNLPWQKAIYQYGIVNNQENMYFKRLNIFIKSDKKIRF